MGLKVGNWGYFTPISGVMVLYLYPKDPDMPQERDFPYNPMTWGWDVSTINPTIFWEGSGFTGFGAYLEQKYIHSLKN